MIRASNGTGPRFCAASKACRVLLGVFTLETPQLRSRFPAKRTETAPSGPDIGGYRFKIQKTGNPQSKIVLIAWFSLGGVGCLPLLFHRLVYVTVVERLLDVGLLGFGMIDEFQRVRHRFLNDPEGGGESVFVIFEAAM